MGVVYKAEDTELKRTVALKFLSIESTHQEESKLRFINEAQAASKFDHPNICTIHDIIKTEDDQICIVMPCYEGKTLKEMIEKKELGLENSLEIIKQIAEGLKKAHENGIVHRDIKPANIFVTNDGVVKILDFGLAKLSDRTQMTRMGGTIGTVAYISPEQARGEEVDAKTDIWSLGVLIYEMLTGELPFKSDYEQAVIYSILNEEPKYELGIIDPSKKQLEKIIAKCLKKERKERFQSVKEILSALNGGIFRSDSRIKILRTRNITIIILIVIAIIVSIKIFTATLTGKVFDSIAVLPFEYLTKDTSHIYFSQGITNEVIEKIWQVSSLRVPSLKTVLAKVKPGMTYADIARELNVKAVLYARLEKVGTRIRLTASLMDPANDKPLWFQSYEREYEDILKLQSELAQAMVQNVKVTLTPFEQTQISKAQQKVDPKAYELYLIAKHEYMQFASEADFNKYVRYLKQAIKIDSTYAPFYSTLALYYWIGGFEGFVSGITETEKYANKALQMDSSDPTSLITKAKILRAQWKWKEVLKTYEEALKLNPGNPDLMVSYSGILIKLKKINEAINYSKQAIEKDPGVDEDYQNIMAVYCYARKYDEAIALGLEAIKKNKASVWTYNLLADNYAESGRKEEALAALKKSFELGTPEESSSLMLNASGIYIFLGMKKEAMEILDKYLKSRTGKGLNTGWVAAIYALLGDSENAFKWLEKAYTENSITIGDIKIDHSWDKYQNDPRYISMLKRVGLAD